MPISISSFSIMPLLLVVLCSLPMSIRSRASKKRCNPFFLDLGPPRTASVLGEANRHGIHLDCEISARRGAYQVGSLMEVSSSLFHRRDWLSGAALLSSLPPPTC